MKQLILTLAIVVQMLLSSAALAWSPLDGVESVLDKFQSCYFVAASSDEGEGTSEGEEEEEEPDCE